MAVHDNIIDFNKICRLCLMEESVMSSIYSEADEHSNAVPLPLRIMACVSIELNSMDGLPSQICTTCLCQVDGWYKFKDLCETADAVLKQCLKNEPMQLEKITEIRSKAKEIRQFFASPHLVKVEGLDSSLSQTKNFKSVKDVGNGEEFKLYSLLKFGAKSSSRGVKAIKEGTSEITADEKIEKESKEVISIQNDRLNTENDDTLDEESLANRIRLASDSDNFNFSSDDDVSLSVKQKKLLNEKNKGSKLKTKKKIKTESATKCMRTVQVQTGVDDDENGEVTESRENFVWEKKDSCARKKMKSRKTQTPREQSSSKKRFRIRPAVPSSCTLCDKVYKNSEILRQHMKSHHVTGTIECLSCKLTFTSLRSLKYHEQRKHSNLEPVPCTFCGKKFLDKKYLRIHENIHSQTNHFVCQFCGRKFIMKTNLTVHISRHHTKKSNDFICQICGKAFPFKLYLKKHFKTHTDYKPYQCSYCEAKFRENTLLRKHVNSIHLKLRPFLCQYCHKTFTRSLYLREHMESQHLGIQRKVECRRCGGTFQNRNRLRQHECMGRMEVIRVE